MGRIKKITLPLFFIIFFAAAFIFLSSHFMGSHFEPETDLANSSLLNNQSTNVKPVEQEKPKIVSDKGADSTGLTEEEKQRLANEPVGNLEDGTRSVIVKLRDINANDLREANPGIDDEAVLQTLGIKAFGAGSLGAESGSTPDINSYYKNAISKKADKLIAEIEHLGGDAKLDKKLKVSPIVFFHVNAKGLEDLKRSALVESVENNHMIFATATEVPLSPDPIAVMGGNSANGFSFAGQNFNGSNYAVAVLDTGVDRLHEKLQGKVIGEACFSYYQRSTYNSLCPGSTKTTTGVDEKHGTGSAQPCTLNDLCAHGSHVASDAALSYQPIYNSAHTGEGTTYSDKNYYSNTINGWISGGARDASVFAVQVFSMKANQSDVTSVNSAWLAAVDWIVENADNRSEIPVPISAINLSLGSGGNSVQNCYTTSSSYRAIFKIAKANDIAVFIANGNAWDSQKNNVATPSCTIGAVSVAASNNSGTAISSYSQNSKATALVSVGGAVLAYADSSGAIGCNGGAVPCALGPNTLIWGAFANHSGAHSWTTMQGTSMASPLAAGIYTSLKSFKPDTPPAVLTNIMQATGQALNDSRTSATTGAKPLIQGESAMQALSNAGQKPIIRYFKTSNSSASQTSATQITLSGRALGASKCAISNKVGVITPDSSGYFSVSSVINAYDFDLTCVNQNGDAYSNYFLEPSSQVEPSSINANDVVLDRGGSQNINPEVLPSGANNKQLDYSSADENIATVDESGLITARSHGSTTITITSWAVETLTKTINVTVNDNSAVSSVSIADASKNYVFENIGDAFTFESIVLPESAADKSVLWSSSDPSVVAFDNSQNPALGNSPIATALKSGVVTITVTTVDGGLTDSTQAFVSIDVESVTLDQHNLEIRNDSSAQLSAAVSPSQYQNAPLTWASSDESVALVDSQGFITPQSVGFATITVKSNENPDACDSAAVEVFQKVDFLTLSPAQATLNIGQDLTLGKTVLPNSAKYKDVIYSTTNEHIASVNSSTGEVIGVNGGYATITATTTDGTGLTAAADIEVLSPLPDVSYVGIAPKNITIDLNANYSFSTEVLPSDASDTSVTYEITTPGSDAAIDPNTGQLFSGSRPFEGLTVKVQSNQNPALFDEATVRIVKAVASVNLTPSSSELGTGRALQLAQEILPVDATDKTLIFSSNNEAVAQVEENGLVTALAPGAATITAESINTVSGSVKGEAVINVFQSVESVALTPESSEIKINDNPDENAVQLAASILPTNAADKSVSYYSSNEFVAQVSENGLVSAGANPGTATITVVTNDGNFTDEAVVKVVQPVTGVHFIVNQAQVKLGGLYRLLTTVSPVLASDKSVTYFSNNEAVAQVDARGFVKGVSAGVADITVRTVDGGFTDVIHITVYSAAQDVSLAPKNPPTLRIGAFLQMSANVLPASAPNKSVTFRTSNPAVVVINQAGLAEAIAPGSATITVQTQDGYFEDTAQISVSLN